MNQKILKNYLALLAILLVVSLGCQDKLANSPEYRKPSWLAGKLYDQIMAQQELSEFGKCLRITGYDTIINVSGSYTVFAPTNDAIATFLQQYGYNSIEDVPVEELNRIVKYHIVQNPWSTDQLKQLDVYGWIDSTDLNNDEPRGFKRETMLREKDRKFGVASNNFHQIIIVDTTLSAWYRRQATDARKYVPFFYKEYFQIFELQPGDYSFYFGRTFDPQSIYFAGSKLITGKENIFAENGFVHEIDKVQLPLDNAYQILERKTQPGNLDYSKFLNLINSFPVFTYNKTRTLAQPGAKQGLVVDSLFDITYPQLAFDLTNESTKGPAGSIGLPTNVTIRYHHGMIAPTNKAIDDFISKYIAGDNQWGSIDIMPANIKRIIVNSSLSTYPIYPSMFQNGVKNGENDEIQLDSTTIVQKEFGSNCTFIGVNEMVVPRAFKAVTGPVYLQPGYKTTMYAIEQSGLLATLKKKDNPYLLFVEPDVNLSTDSSLILTIDKNDVSFTAFITTKNQKPTVVPLSVTDIRTLIMNHIGIGIPKGIAKKEFIPNLAGNFLVINNETGEVKGTLPSTVGYSGSVQISVIPEKISTDADNGSTYRISNWFNFSSKDLFTTISSQFPAFHKLLQKAGLSDNNYGRYTFLSETDNYTVFAPTDSALAKYNSDTLTTDELKKFLMFHFVQGSLIFTDGNSAVGYYETARIDEKSTPFSNVYTKIFISPDYDNIYFMDKTNAVYLDVPESDNTNIITGRKLGTGQEPIPQVVCNSVIHSIDKVLLVNKTITQ